MSSSEASSSSLQSLSAFYIKEKQCSNLSCSSCPKTCNWCNRLCTWKRWTPSALFSTQLWSLGNTDRRISSINFLHTYHPASQRTIKTSSNINWYIGALIDCARFINLHTLKILHHYEDFTFPLRFLFRWSRPYHTNNASINAYHNFIFIVIKH